MSSIIFKLVHDTVFRYIQLKQNKMTIPVLKNDHVQGCIPLGGGGWYTVNNVRYSNFSSIKLLLL